MHFRGFEPPEADHRGGCQTVWPVLLENEAMGQEGVRADTCPHGLLPLWVIGSPWPALACSPDPAERHVTSVGATHCKEQHAFPFIPGDGRGVKSNRRDICCTLTMPWALRPESDVQYLI